MSPLGIEMEWYINSEEEKIICKFYILEIVNEIHIICILFAYNDAKIQNKYIPNLNERKDDTFINLV